MAKFECCFPSGYDFDEVLNYFHQHLSTSSVSASYESGSDYRSGAVRACVRVYERYTLMGNNRLSMTVMLASSGQEIFASAITAAGGNGVWKLAGWGEEEFLEHFISAAKQFEDVEILRKNRM